HTVESWFSRQIVGDVGDLDGRDRVDDDAAVVHLVSIACFYVETLPDADAASDSPAPDTFTKTFGKHHGLRFEDRAPRRWVHVRDVLREGPPVSVQILHRVMALPERHVLRRLEDLCSESLGMLEMPIHIVHAREDVLMKLAGTHRFERAAAAADHDVAGSGEQLGMSHDPVAIRRSQSLAKPKGSAQP